MYISLAVVLEKISGESSSGMIWAETGGTSCPSFGSTKNQRGLNSQDTRLHGDAVGVECSVLSNSAHC